MPDGSDVSLGDIDYTRDVSPTRTMLPGSTLHASDAMGSDSSCVSPASDGQTPKTHHLLLSVRFSRSKNRAFGVRTLFINPGR
jgi:hypothetical protein